MKYLAMLDKFSGFLEEIKISLVFKIQLLRN